LTAAPAVAFSAGDFASFIILFAASGNFSLSLLSLFFAGGFQTTFLSLIATLLQVYTDERNRGRVMSLFGLINRGRGPMGSFPFGLVATWIGAPLTVGICGILTVSLAAAVLQWRPHLRSTKWIDDT
jgi:Transmembrane secretion effector